ncbi:hypothetical protein PI124_g3382 [Phytophthora idaei]|nr:hypothetical protein PI125_g19091 [Phytophthora idaei]KAG3171068.1 hypothetical protein PI126_g2042 [Phytophthora idaei]KAG3252048.1 hypothetical protein PI124_g3382 [Phytophthora idaei]
MSSSARHGGLVSADMQLTACCSWGDAIEGLLRETFVLAEMWTVAVLLDSKSLPISLLSTVELRNTCRGK